MEYTVTFNILVCFMVTVLKLSSPLKDDPAQFNPNVPPGFISGEPAAKSENTSSSLNVSSNSTSTATIEPTTISQTTSLIISSPSITNNKVLENINTSSTKRSTQGRSTENPTSKQSTALKSTPTKPMQSTVQTKSLLSGTSTPLSSSNSSLSTSSISTSAQQTPNVTSSKPTPVSIAQSSVSTNTNNNSESNYTTQSIFVSIVQENASATSLKTTVTPFNKTTTNSFDNISPWNIPRSTYEPRRNGSHETQTETNRKDDYDKGDTFWPVAVALTIGVPTIIVFAITITVLYRRRMNKPRGLLGIYGTDYQSI